MPAADPFERETPRSTLTALLRALAEQDYQLAQRYFDLPEDGEANGAAIAAALQQSLDAGGTLRPYSELSNDPSGALEDGLEPDMELVGTLGGGIDEPILLVRTEAEDGQPVWQIAPETWRQLETAPQVSSDEAEAPATTIAGAPVMDWLTLLGLLLAAYLLLRALSVVAMWVLRRLMRNYAESRLYRFLHAAMPPISMLLALIVFGIWGQAAPVSIIARQTLMRYLVIAFWFAFTWLALRLIDALSGIVTSRMARMERRQAASVVVLVRRVAKLAILAIALFAILDTLGFDITTGIAALGIGGLVLALGAQKTVENFVGTVSVIADRPIQVGDFCKVGDVSGTVEDIGMRSTRIRTNERTVVSIPNGDFSTRQIENFSERDRFLFNPVIGIEYSLTAAKLREALAIVTGLLEQHEKVLEDPRRARLRAFGADAMEIEVFAYINVPDFAQSLIVREELLLTIYERFEQAEIPIAFPTRTIYLRGEDGNPVKIERASPADPAPASP
jgi:MscS family membrane protein